MIRLLMAIGLALATTQASAQIAVPKSYVDGEVIHADELNTNLKAIADVVPPRDCTTDQIIKWDGSAWVCADMPSANDGGDGVAAGLSCSTDQVVVYRDGAWVCSSLEKTSDFFGFDEAYIGSVDCPLGKKVTGGGCAFDKKSGGFCSREISKPLDNLEGWYCRTFGSGGCFVYEVWAICL